MKDWGNILTVVGLGLLAGGMLFFAAAMAPLIFTRLPLPVAGGFIRQAFPVYYAYCLATGGIALVGTLMLGRRKVAGLLAALLAADAWCWLGLLPIMDRLRLANDSAGFAFWHLVSTSIDGAVFLVVLILLARTAIQHPRALPAS
jgi:hypothetical protein